MPFIHEVPPAGRRLCVTSPNPHTLETKTYWANRIGLHVVAIQTVLSVGRLAPLTQTTVPERVPVGLFSFFTIRLVLDCCTLPCLACVCIQFWCIYISTSCAA